MMNGELGDHVGKLVLANPELIPDSPEPGVLFHDITPLITSGTALRELTQALGEYYAGKIGAIAELKSCGFILGVPPTTELGIGMLTIHKAGKLPGHAADVDYALEYGNARTEIRPESVASGARVLIVGDVLTTGGIAEASVDLLRQCGAEVATVAVLPELEVFSGWEVLANKGVSVGSAPFV